MYYLTVDENDNEICSHKPFDDYGEALESIGRINAHFSHVQQFWTAVDSLGNRAMHPESG
jgi:hypothetical protein